MSRCPECDHDLSGAVGSCPTCGHPLNGLAGTKAEEASRPAPPMARPPGKLSPELMEWARQQFSKEEFAAGLKEIQEAGGLELQDFIQELEREAEPRD